MLEIDNIGRGKNIMKDPKDMTEQELVVLGKEVFDIIQKIKTKKVIDIKDSVISKLKKKLKRFVDMRWQIPIGHVQVSVKMPVYLNCDDDVFYLYLSYDMNVGPCIRMMENTAELAVEKNVPLNKKLKNIQKDLDAFLTDMKNTAKEHNMEENILWEMVDPNGNWH